MFAVQCLSPELFCVILALLGNISVPTFLLRLALHRKNDSYVLPLPKTTDLSLEPEEHLLTLKSATLGVDAVEKERNVVEISYHDREDKSTSSVLASLTLGTFFLARLHRIFGLCHM